jgi:hypothetical protein
MNRFISTSQACVLVALNAALLGACSADAGTPPDGLSSGSTGSAATGSGEVSGAASGDATGSNTGAGSAGSGSTGSGAAGAGTAGSAGGASGSTGSGTTGSTGSGAAGSAGSGIMSGSVASGVNSGSAPGDADASVGATGDDASVAKDAGKGAHGGSDASENADIVVPSGCTLPSPVSFQKDVQPFLTSSCSGAGGCHVTDASSTVANGGYTHAYDWITGTAHNSSCPEMPTPFRFQVVIAVIDAANPPSCSKSSIMPPANAVEKPLTACQIATLQAWLAEPLVTQMHRADGISPTTPYAMPPFN